MPSTYDPNPAVLKATPLVLSVLIWLFTVLSIYPLAASLIGGFLLVHSELSALGRSTSKFWPDILVVLFFIMGCIGWHALIWLRIFHYRMPYAEVPRYLCVNAAAGVLINLSLVVPAMWSIPWSMLPVVLYMLSPTFLCCLLFIKIKRYNQPQV